jgi:hypothetical protein
MSEEKGSSTRRDFLSRSTVARGLFGQHKLGDGRAARGGGANPGSQTKEVVAKPGRYLSAGIGEG